VRTPPTSAVFWAFVGKALAWVTLADVQAYADQLGQGTLAPANADRALTAVKSLLSFGHETGYLPFNAGVAVKLRPQRDSLAQRILGESEVAKLIEAAPDGRDRVLLRGRFKSPCSIVFSHFRKAGAWPRQP